MMCYLLWPLTLTSAILLVHASAPTWVSLNLTVPSFIEDGDPNFNFVDVLIGTPPQTMPLVIDLQSDAITLHSSDCPLCSGTNFFEASESSSYKRNDAHPSRGTSLYNGSWATDILGFGGLVENQGQDFVLVDTMSTNLSFRLHNGAIGLLADAFRTTPIAHVVPSLYESGQLLNPVIGLRLDPMNPKMTVGALDPADYEGTMNWVQLEPNQLDWNLYNLFKIDGFRGRNGSLIPFTEPLLTGIDSLFDNIAMPDNFTYFLNDNYTGPVTNNTISIDDSSGAVSYLCNNTSRLPGVSIPPAYVDLSVSINGISYQIDSADNLVRREGGLFASIGHCHVGIISNNPKGEPGAILGLPFLRSVYFAYRFPTASCPGYYGFAFPSGANRTRTQISQTPTSTPTLSSQCLALTSPTSTPTVMHVSNAATTATDKLYAVYGNDSLQVPLKGVDLLMKGVWNVTG